MCAGGPGDEGNDGDEGVVVTLLAPIRRNRGPMEGSR